ncbi:MAG: HK97 gp10 family phage protein [Sulfurimonas sp.]|nr:HK97 gp10 family phage protein [Sulfurimonas sp.]PHQ90108.1 MAG: hypothetical protein COB42_05695 [Sulfurimonas sp.]
MSQALGMEELLKNLETIPDKVQKRILVGAVRAGAKPIATEAKNLVPKDTGNLKKSIGVTKLKVRKKNLVFFQVSPRSYGKHDGYYGLFLELGTSKMIAHPFMRPAFEKEGENSIIAVKEYIAKRLDKELSR